jgi:hypothetical protein
MNARTTKTIAVKPTATAKAAKATVEHKDVVRDDEFLDDVMKRYEEAREALFGFFQTPSWKRTLCAFVTTIAVSVGIGWLSGTLLGWLVVGATVLAVPTFITMVVYMLGLAAAVFYGTKIAIRIGGAVLTGEADERAVAAYDAMKGAVKKLWPFGKQPELAS